MNRSRDQRSDEELVEVCNRGGAEEAERAFEALYRRHREYVTRVALRFVRDRDLALDVVQETFVYLLRKFPPTGEGLVLTARIQTLLYPVAKSCAITALRKAERAGGMGAGSAGLGASARPSGPGPTAAKSPRNPVPVPMTVPDPDELPADCAPPESEVIDAALAGLSAERREVLTLRFVEGLSLAEIAAMLGVPLGTVKSRLHLAIKQLREDPAVRALFDR